MSGNSGREDGVRSVKRPWNKIVNHGEKMEIG